MNYKKMLSELIRDKFDFIEKEQIPEYRKIEKQQELIECAMHYKLDVDCITEMVIDLSY